VVHNLGGLTGCLRKRRAARSFVSVERFGRTRRRGVVGRRRDVELRRALLPVRRRIEDSCLQHRAATGATSAVPWWCGSPGSINVTRLPNSAHMRPIEAAFGET